MFEHSTPLPVVRYGGTERFIFWLMCELIRKGNKVTLLGHPESRVREHGIDLIPVAQGDDWRIRIPDSADCLHLFATPSFTPQLPYLVTIEGNGQTGEIFHKNTVFISKRHAQNHGSEVFIYNGIQMDDFSLSSGVQNNIDNWGRFLFLAKASWKVKNLEACVRACKKAKKTLEVAGGRVFWPSRYIRSNGMVDDQQKRVLFERSSALLFPVRWHEPFGIAIIEAFASGLPVVGSSYGSLPELISEETGTVCKNFDAFLDSIGTRPGHFSANRIREVARERFGIDRIASKYLAQYQRVINGENLNENNPQTLKGFIAEELLPF